METSCKVDEIYYIFYKKDVGFYDKNQRGYQFCWTDKLINAKRYKKIENVSKFILCGTMFGDKIPDCLIYKCQEKNGNISIIGDAIDPEIYRKPKKIRMKIKMEDEIKKWEKRNK